MASPIKYASRTYQTILNDINSIANLADKPDFFKKQVAGVGDVCSMINNAQANNSYLGTSFTRQAVKENARLIGYEMPEQTTSVGTMLFYFPSTVTFPFTVARADLAATTKGTVAISARRFEARDQATFTLVTEVVNITSNPPSNNSVLVARDFMTGEKVRLSSSGTLPTGLASTRDYYIVRVDATHVQFALSIIDALAGNEVTISGGSGNLTITLYSGRVTAYQQELKSNINIGTSDGITDWQEFSLPDFNILSDTVSITINGVLWNQVDTLATSISYDSSYQLIYNTDGSAFIRFGNNLCGSIPANFDILATYAIGGGADANISTLNSITVYAGSDANISGCANGTAFTGGSDRQSIETAKNTATGALKSLDRFVTIADGETLSLGYGGLSLVNVIANAYGVLSAKVVAIATGGGNPNSTTKSGLQTYLINRSLLSGVDIRVVDATITTENVVSAAKMLSGYTFANVLPYFRLAWKLLLAETGQEILDLYKSDGISATIARINTIYSESFTANDYTKVQQLLDGLYRFGAAQFGYTLRDDDVKAFILAYVDGIDYITYSSPTLPIACASDQITTFETLTLTEIP